MMLYNSFDSEWPDKFWPVLMGTRHLKLEPVHYKVAVQDNLHLICLLGHFLQMKLLL